MALASKKTGMKYILHSVVFFCLFVPIVSSSVLGAEADSGTRPVLKPGIVVDSLLTNFEAEKAGIRVGDILLRWSRGDESGAIVYPFDLLYIMIEQASRGSLELEGLRGENKRIWRLGSNYWGIKAHPNFSGQLSPVYQEEKELVQAAGLPQAVEHWRKLSTVNLGYHLPWLGPWLLSYLAELSSSRSWEGYDDAYQEAIEEAGAEPAVKAQLLKQWAGAFKDRGDLSSAAKHYEEAISEYRKLGIRTMAVSTALKELGAIAYSQGNMAQADECFQESFGIAAELAPHSIQLVWDFIWLGVLRQARGDLAGAEDYYRKALVVEQQNFSGSRDLSLTLSKLGTVASRRGDLAKAEAYYRKALGVAEKLGPNSQYLPDILNFLAECLLDRGNPDMAEVYEKRDLAIRQKVNPGSLAVASSLRNLGEIARVRGNLIEAEEYCGRALAIGQAVAPLSEQVQRILVGLGYVARDRGDLIRAQSYLRNALAIIEQSASGSLDHAEALADLAGILYRGEKLDIARQVYQQALTELESETSRLGGIEEKRSHYRALHDHYYTEYVDLLARVGQTESAFQTLDTSRARTLFEMLSRSQIDIRQGVNVGLLAQERDLRQLLNAKLQYRFRLLSESHTDEQVARLDREIADLQDSYLQVKAEIRAGSPGYAALTQPQPLSTLEIQKLLDPETILLEYSLGEPRSLVWLVTNDSLAAYELPRRAEVESAARSAYALLIFRNHTLMENAQLSRHSPTRWTKADREYSQIAAQLSRMILGPVAPFLGKKRLLVVSDGALQYIPFSALPSPERPSVPLIVDHEIVHLPSASVLVELRRIREGRPRPSREVAVLADPVFDSSDERVRGAQNRNSVPSSKTVSAQRSLAKGTASADLLTRSVADLGLRRNGNFYLSRLLSTRQEAERIMAVVPAGKRLKAVDFNASRKIAMDPALAQYRIVHFATHGFLDSKHPELSGIVLSLVDKRGRSVDGFLGLQDIYNLNLPVDLVVLSACETALGEEISGEGLIGLTRGFMYAGASRVVASLWGVSDEATAELMARFYKLIELDGMPPAAALRTAQIQMWKQSRWSSPYYWAAFQIQGEWK